VQVIVLGIACKFGVFEVNVQKISHEDAMSLLDQHNPNRENITMIGNTVYAKCRDAAGGEFVIFTAADGGAGIITI